MLLLFNSYYVPNTESILHVVNNLILPTSHKIDITVSPHLVEDLGDVSLLTACLLAPDIHSNFSGQLRDREGK